MFQLLVADDEYIEREALKSIISRNFSDKIAVAEAANGLDAVSQAKLLEPDIIFIDIKMPGQSGIEAVRQIREFLPEAEIIMITAYDYFDYAKEAISLKVSEFLIKPIDIHALIALINTLVKNLEKKKASQRNTFEMESKLEMIKNRYEQEFMDSLQNYNTTPDMIKDYLNIIDCSFAKAVAVVLNFKEIKQDKEIGRIQKDFICTRFLSRIKSESEKMGFKCMQQYEDDLALLFFIISENKDNTLKDEFKNRIVDLMEENRNKISTSVSYKCSDLIETLHNLPGVIIQFKQDCLGNKNNPVYPYEIEEKLINELEKLNFKGARQSVAEVIKIFSASSHSELFISEIHGLYAIIRRCIKYISKNALMPHADELLETVRSDHDAISFFLRILDYAESSMEEKGNRNQVLIQQFCDYLEQHYQEEISLEEAAGMVGFSTFYFSRLMKEFCHMSYVDYVSSVRVKKAKELFDTTNKTISQIAMLVGYSDPNYFTRVFKKTTGETPSAYREK